MKFFKLIFILIALVVPSHLQAAPALETARLFFKELIHVATLQQIETRRAQTRLLIGKHFDFENFYRRALVDHWESWPAAHRETFDRKFREKFISHLSKHLGRLDRIAKADVRYRQRLQKNESVVTATGYLDGKEVIVTLYLVPTTGGWKVCDLDISGAKLSRNYRGSFNYVLRNSGFTGLLAKLEVF